MVATPGTSGVTQVEAIPLSSVMAEQLVNPPQAENAALLVLVHPRVAPPTGVTPSAATGRTAPGLGACVPTGVGGFPPSNKTRVSVAAAPKVTASVMIEKAPLIGSVIVIVCGPST